MTVTAIGPTPAQPDIRSPDDKETFFAFDAMSDGNGDAPAAIPAGAQSAGATSAGPLGGIGLHKRVHALAHAAPGAAQPGPQAGAVLYSGKESAARGAAPAAARPTREQVIERCVDVFAKAGKLDVLGQWLSRDPARRVHFETQPGSASYYDASRRVMVLGADATPAEHAQAIVFEQRRQHYEQQYRGHEPKTREEYVARAIDRVLAPAAADAVEFGRRLQEAGAATSATSAMDNVYQRAYQQELNESLARRLPRLSTPPALGELRAERSSAEEDARVAARKALGEAFASGKLRPADARETYPAVFGREFETKQAAENTRKAQEAAKTHAAAQADNDRRAQADAGRKVLVEAIRAAAQEQVQGNKASVQKAQVVELLFAFSVKYPADLDLLMPQIAPALSQLLGAYGFMTWEQIGAQGKGSGKMELQRLHYAIENFRRLTAEERMLLEHGAKPASKFGISLMLTPAELQARESYEISMPLPDGTPFRGTPAKYREASMRNINNHALAQLKQIRSASVMSLVGRAFAGEKGAAIGAMFDAFVDVGNAQKARVQVRSGVPTPTDTDHRTPIDPARRAPASPRAPADEGRPLPLSGSSRPRSNAPGTPGPGTHDTGSGPHTAGTGSGSGTVGTTGAGSSPGAAQAGNTGGGLPQSTYLTDPRRITVRTAARGEQDMTLGEYRSRVQQAHQWISSQGPYDLGGAPRHMYDRAAAIFTLDLNWQYLGNPHINTW